MSHFNNFHLLSLTKFVQGAPHTRPLLPGIGSCQSEIDTAIGWIKFKGEGYQYSVFLFVSKYYGKTKINLR